jgi:hypothetical protein
MAVTDDFNPTGGDTSKEPSRLWLADKLARDNALNERLAAQATEFFKEHGEDLDLFAREVGAWAAWLCNPVDPDEL